MATCFWQYVLPHLDQQKIKLPNQQHYCQSGEWETYENLIDEQTGQYSLLCRWRHHQGID